MKSQGKAEDLPLRNNWTSFRFESNQSFGYCNTKEEWLKVKALYLEYWETIELNKAMLSVEYKGSVVPSFGFRMEHLKGTYSLEDFAKDNGMEL